MELVFDLQNAQSMAATQLMSKTFTESGGVIGRNPDCDWTLLDSTQRVSKYHARISYRDGAFFLTDISSNGVQVNRSDRWLNSGQPQRIEHGAVFGLGDFEIRARLDHELHELLEQVGRPQAAGKIIPDEVFFNLDPIDPVAATASVSSILDEPTRLDGVGPDWEQPVDFAQIDFENLVVPTLVDAEPPVSAEPRITAKMPANETFWQTFGEVLGVDFVALDEPAREALALKAARLLKQSVVGLQQSLWTRSELKNELRLARTVAPDTRHNPLKSSHDAFEALGLLLQPGKPYQASAEQVIAAAFRDVQAHQVALIHASRAAVRSSLEHFSPQQLSLRLERDGFKPLFATAGSRWRAFGRYHQALQQDNDWSERLLARDFAQAYEEQIRLISTLHNDPQG